MSAVGPQDVQTPGFRITLRCGAGLQVQADRLKPQPEADISAVDLELPEAR
jgi:hypothetical protein